MRTSASVFATGNAQIYDLRPSVGIEETQNHHVIVLRPVKNSRGALAENGGVPPRGEQGVETSA